MASKNINVTLKIWRQQNANAKGKMETYNLDNVSTDSSFLEMLDQLNEQSTIDHSRAPNEEICITASHSETTNQHAQSAGLARQARSDFMAAKEQGTLRYPHSLTLTDYSPAQSCVQRAITSALCLSLESSLGSSILHC